MITNQIHSYPHYKQKLLVLHLQVLIPKAKQMNSLHIIEFSRKMRKVLLSKFNQQKTGLHKKIKNN